LEYKSEIHVLWIKKSQWFWPNKKKAQEWAAKQFYEKYNEPKNKHWKK
jgi:hypothetical protein